MRWMLILLFAGVAAGQGGRTELEKGLRAALEEAQKTGNAPGGVVRVEQLGRFAVEVVSGNRSEIPEEEPMPADAVFDLASLTKCVATTTCVMKLIEEGRLHLGDRAAQYLPGFAKNGKESITIEQLLRHRSGLLPDNALSDYQQGPEVARQRVFDLGLRAPPPGSRYIYTDIGFIVLGWIVEKVTGKPLDVYAAESVFEPLGMRSTRFIRTDAAPDPDFVRRCVPTEPAAKGEPPLRGIVHDPRARLLGGVAGHAGLFSSAQDLSTFAAMLLRGGSRADGTRILKQETIRLMTALPDDLSPGERRALGWDMRPLRGRQLGPRGAHFPEDSFGHTGFTGTSMWMDPRSRTLVVLLTSRLHPDGEGNVSRLRYQAGTLAAEAVRQRPWPLQRVAPDRDAPRPDRQRIRRRAPATRRETVRTGLDRFRDGAWPERLRGRRVGLITNHTGRDARGRSAIDLLHGSKDVTLAALFSPEHGIRGALDARVPDEKDTTTGLVIHSLYGKTRRPTPEMLRGLDALVFDIQDIGARFYTYASTMVNAMEEAARHGLPFVVLDRPNPIGGEQVEGPVADAQSLDFVGRLRVPVRHGMTMGELARLAKNDLDLELDITVIPCEGWHRPALYDATGLAWVNPSPNMRSLTEALLYPGIGLVETTNVSVGRGTATPFELVGAPWMDGKAVCAALRAMDLPGIAFEPVTFTPDASKHAHATCSGVGFRVTDARALRPVRTGIALALVLRRLHPDAWNTAHLNRLLKNEATLKAVLSGHPLDEIAASWKDDLEAFGARRARCLLY